MYGHQLIMATKVHSLRDTETIYVSCIVGCCIYALNMGIINYFGVGF
jgi:hypothetical protein